MLNISTLRRFFGIEQLKTGLIDGVSVDRLNKFKLLLLLVVSSAYTLIASADSNAQTSQQVAVQSNDVAAQNSQAASRAAEIRLGSQTAKGGFANEEQIRDKLNSWRGDPDAQAWLAALGYDYQELISVHAQKPHGQKADLMLQIDSNKRGKCREGISIKLVSNPDGFNQIDKRWLQQYAEMWQMPDDVHTALKRFVGEIRPDNIVRDARRTFLDEMPEGTQQAVLQFFSTNRQRIVQFLFEGTGEYTAEWLMVTIKPPKREEDLGNRQSDRWIIVPTTKAAEFYGLGDVVISRGGSLRIGRITMQRKGGDNGRESANMLQFKINPVEVFELQAVNDLK